MKIMKKLMNKKGFTLMEMLIVVAIIVILVAIAIPTFSSSLDDAKKATDDANFRGAKGLVEITDMTAGAWKDILGEDKMDDDKVKVYYDIEEGVLTTTAPTTGYGQSSENKGEVIYATVTDGKLDENSLDWYPLSN